jgi:hypothetical protein
MDWLSTGSCSAAHQFGWLVGNASGLYAMAIIVILILSAPAYRADVPFAVSERTRKYTQWGLFVAELLLFGGWLYCAHRVGWEHLSCFVVTFALGAVTVVAPIMLLLMFTAANWIGRASAR